MAKFDEQEERDYLAFRVAIAGGLFASLGATLGWIAWLAYISRSTELGVTIGVGGIVGLIVHWCSHYLHTARRERAGLEPEEGEGKTGHRTLAALLWATGFGFLGLASEHLLAHMAALYLQPLLASLATLMPAGIVLGLMFHLGNRDGRKVSDFLKRGVTTGAGIAVVTSGLWWLMWGKVPFFALFSWWSFVAVGMQAYIPLERNAARIGQPIKGVLLGFAIMVALTFVPGQSKWYDKLGPLSNIPFLAKSMALTVISSPDVPAEPWIKIGGSAKAPPKLGSPPEGGAGQAITSPATQPDWTTTSGSATNTNDATTTTTGYTQTTNDVTTTIGSTSRMDSAAESNAGAMAEKTSAMAKGRKGPLSSSQISDGFDQARLVPPSAVTWQTIFAEMRKGMPSPLFRSWLVMLLFGLGLGLAPVIEIRLRPSDYPSSATFRKDLTVAIALVVAMVAACVIARLNPHPVPSGDVSGTQSARR